MEPAEHFSLCWNNFHANLSSGFQNLLKDEDLVDVTLAAQGHYIKAHKTILSVCSSFFKDLFRANPCKHPIVILPDVNYAALKSLLQFMYQGEVSVSQEEIPSFMKVAETLKVKGLTDNMDTPNGYPTLPKSSFTTSTPLSNFQKRPRSSSSIKKNIRPHNPSLRTLSSPNRPSISPQPSIISTDSILPPLKKQMLDPLASTADIQPETNFIQVNETHTVTSSHSTPSSSPAPLQAMALVKPKDEPVDAGGDEGSSHAQVEDSITIEPSTLLDSQIGEGSSSVGEPSPTHQMPVWPSAENIVASAVTPAPEDTSQPGNPGGLILVKSGKGQLVLIHDGHMYTFCDQRNNQSLWICVKKRVLNCKGCLITLDSGMLNSRIVLSCLAHNHPQMHDVIQRLYVPKRPGATTGGASCSTSPALNTANK